MRKGEWEGERVRERGESERGDLASGRERVSD